MTACSRDFVVDGVFIDTLGEDPQDQDAFCRHFCRGETYPPDETAGDVHVLFQLACDGVPGWVLCSPRNELRVLAVPDQS